MNTILAVNANIPVHERQAAECMKHGIAALRVDTMTEAISRLAKGDEFLFVAIIEAATPDFMEQLPIMRDVTHFPIFVFTDSYTAEKKAKAMNLGADVYDPFSAYSENILIALEELKAQNRWAKRPVKPLPVLIGGDIILSPPRRKVFVSDKEIILVKKEFDLLRYLIANSGRFLTQEQLLRKVWGEEYSDNGSDHHVGAPLRFSTRRGDSLVGEQPGDVARGFSKKEQTVD